MKFLSHIRSRSRLKGTDDTDHNAYPHHGHATKTSNARARPNPTAKFSAALLEQLLRYVCPHAQDDTYTSCEESMIDGGCMLCDMRDLSQCAFVNKQWSEAAQNVLYHNIRIDAVHYCDREATLAAKRKRRSFSGRNGEYSNPPQERLQLLSRTVRENGSLAKTVQYFKTPYMTREGSVADLARTITFLPNLLYVDLPDGCYNDDPSSGTLKQELQARCPKLRHMKYYSGSEGSFQMLAQPSYWRDLSTLELSHLAVEPTTIIDVFVSLTALHEIKLANLRFLDDSIFQPGSYSTSFPPLEKLTLQDLPNISAQGLLAYLSKQEPKIALHSLILINTGIPTPDVHQILFAAPNLTSLHITTSVTQALPSPRIPSLASRSLQNLHYEITNANTSPDGLVSPSDSYYAYLSSSVLNGSLPSLTHLYALSVTPQSLLQPASRSAFSANRAGAVPPPLSLGITRPLRLFTKSISELEWTLTLITPPSPTHRRGSTTTTGPESLYHAAPLSPQYRNKGRQSVMVGNGFGGFLAVPSDKSIPGSPKSKSKRQDLDAWMG